MHLLCIDCHKHEAEAIVAQLDTDLDEPEAALHTAETDSAVVEAFRDLTRCAVCHHGELRTYATPEPGYARLGGLVGKRMILPPQAVEVESGE